MAPLKPVFYIDLFRLETLPCLKDMAPLKRLCFLTSDKPHAALTMSEKTWLH